MEKEDARKQSREVLHERRKQVICMHRKGMAVMQIVEHSGLSWYAVNAAITAYSTAGAAALKPAARGKKQGSGRMLSESQESAVRQIICDKRPEQLKMEFALWNRATVTNQGKTRWMIIDESFNSDKLIEFLQALIRDAGKKVFLILDNLRVHHSKPVKAWVEAHKDKIELFYLPSYSPELNPEERLNADLKQALYTKVPARTKAKLKTAATEHSRR